MSDKYRKGNIILDKTSDNKIIVKGKELGVRWLDSYILIYSEKDHPYDEVID